ncbi:phosphotransferase [Nocardia sp. NRRL WC-3656]|uniref:phosphotransferase n=1 Tax=Nocardia sp. NRRL WC-3656 TaxID=1463824 RepID=UPI0004C40DAF|nr:phosphotransferase [Nocardia sp. NRRL WC-3656]
MSDALLLDPVVQARKLFESLPTAIRRPIEMVVFGGDLPQADISRMRSMVADLRNTAATIDHHAHDAEALLAQQDSQGDFGEALREALSSLPDGGAKLSEEARVLADHANEVANEAEKTLCVMLVFGIELGWRIVRILSAAAAAGAVGEAAAAPTIEASLMEGRAEVEAMHRGLEQVYRRIAGDTAARLSAVGPVRFGVTVGRAALLPTLVDGGVQMMQVAAGYRNLAPIGDNGENPNGLDIKSILSAAVAGAGGAVGGMAAARAAPVVFPRMQTSRTLAGLVHGMAGAGAGVGAAALITGWPGDFHHLLAPMLNGAFAGTIHAQPGAHTGFGPSKAIVGGAGLFGSPDLDAGRSTEIGFAAGAPVEISAESMQKWEDARRAWSAARDPGHASTTEVHADTPPAKSRTTRPGPLQDHVAASGDLTASAQPIGGPRRTESEAHVTAKLIPSAAEAPAVQPVSADLAVHSVDEGSMAPVGSQTASRTMLSEQSHQEPNKTRPIATEEAVSSDESAHQEHPDTRTRSTLESETVVPPKASVEVPPRVAAPQLGASSVQDQAGSHAVPSVVTGAETAPAPKIAAHALHHGVGASGEQHAEAEQSVRTYETGTTGKITLVRESGIESANPPHVPVDAEEGGGQGPEASAVEQNMPGGDTNHSDETAVVARVDTVSTPVSVDEAAPSALNSRDRAEEALADFHKRSDEHIAEAQRLSNLPDEVLQAGLFHTDERESLIAGMEIIRRRTIGDAPGGMVLRSQQLEGGFEMARRPVQMLPGQGKTLMFMSYSLNEAVRHGSVLLVTTADGLAHREYTEYRRVFGDFGIDVLRADQETGFGPVTPGRPAIVIATGETVGHLCNAGHAPPRRVVIDEMDAIVDRGERTFIRSEGSQKAALDDTASEVLDATDFLAGALANGMLSHEDFGLARFIEEVDVELPDGTVEIGTENWYVGRAELTPAGRMKLEALPNGKRWLHNMGASRLEMAAAAEFTCRNNIHYVMDQGKVVIIDQGEHGLQRNPKTASESRWSAEPGKASLAQAVEAKEIRAAGTDAAQHLIVVRADADSAKSITAAEIYGTNRFFDHITGASGTLTDLGGVLNAVYRLDTPHEVEPFNPTRLVEGQPDVHADTRAKINALAGYAHEMWDGGRGRFQEILCHRNDLVDKQVQALVRAGVPREAIEAVDADRIAKWGANWEAELQQIFHSAGEQGKILVINRQGQRGVDIAVSDDVLAKGGMHVWMTEVPEQSYIYDQAKNRTARNGKPGSVQALMSPSDELIRKAMHLRAVREAVVYYDAAVADHRAEPTPETRDILSEADEKLRSLVPDLQRRAHQHATADFIHRYAAPSAQQSLPDPPTSWYPRTSSLDAADQVMDRSARLADLLGIPRPVLTAAAVPAPHDQTAPQIADIPRAGAHDDRTADPVRRLLDRTLPPAAVEALRQQVDATFPPTALQYALLPDEQAVDQLIHRRDALAEHLGQSHEQIEGIEGLRGISAALTDFRYTLASALDVPPLDITPAIARDILGEAVVDSLSDNSPYRHSATDSRQAIDSTVRSPATGGLDIANRVDIAASYLATAVLLELISEIIRRRPNSCANGLAAMRILCPDNKNRFVIPPDPITLRGHDLDALRNAFRGGRPKRLDSLDDAVEALKLRPGGIQVLVYAWKNTQNTGNTDTDHRVVVLVNDNEPGTPANPVVVDLTADQNSSINLDPQDFVDRRALLKKATKFDIWRRTQQEFIDKLPESQRAFWGIDFEPTGHLGQASDGIGARRTAVGGSHKVVAYPKADANGHDRPSVRTAVSVMSFADLMDNAIAGGVAHVDSMPGPTGVVIELVAFHNGFRATRETYDYPEGATTQWMLSLIGRAMGAPVAATWQHRNPDKRTVLYREIVPGSPAKMELPELVARAYDLGLVHEELDEQQKELAKGFDPVDRTYLDSALGDLLGLFDAATEMRRSTRHWNIGPDGAVTAGRGATTTEDAAPSPFAAKFVRYINGRAVWQPHHFPRHEITAMRERVSYVWELIEQRLAYAPEAHLEMLHTTYQRVLLALIQAEQRAVHTTDEILQLSGLSADAQVKARLVEEFALKHPYFAIVGFDAPLLLVDAAEEILETLDDLLTKYRYAPGLSRHMTNIRGLRVDFMEIPGNNAETRLCNFDEIDRVEWIWFNLRRASDRARALDIDTRSDADGFHPSSGRPFHDDVIHEFGHAIDFATGGQLSADIEHVLYETWRALRNHGVIVESYEPWIRRLPKHAFTNFSRDDSLNTFEAVAVGFVDSEINGPNFGTPQWAIHHYLTTGRLPEVADTQRHGLEELNADRSVANLSTTNVVAVTPSVASPPLESAQDDEHAVAIAEQRGERPTPWSRQPTAKDLRSALRDDAETGSNTAKPGSEIDKFGRSAVEPGTADAIAEALDLPSPRRAWAAADPMTPAAIDSRRPLPWVVNADNPSLTAASANRQVTRILGGGESPVRAEVPEGERNPPAQPDPVSASRADNTSADPVDADPLAAVNAELLDLVLAGIDDERQDAEPRAIDAVTYADMDRYKRLDDSYRFIDELRDAMARPGSVPPERVGLLVHHFHAVAEWLAALLDANRATRPDRQLAHSAEVKERLATEATVRFQTADDRVTELLTVLAARSTETSTRGEDLSLLSTVDWSLLAKVREFIDAEYLAAAIDSRKAVLYTDVTRYERLRDMRALLRELDGLLRRSEQTITLGRTRPLVQFFHAAAEWSAALISASHAVEPNRQQAHSNNDQQRWADVAVDRFRAADRRIREVGAKLAVDQSPTELPAAARATERQTPWSDTNVDRAEQSDVPDGHAELPQGIRTMPGSGGTGEVIASKSVFRGPVGPVDIASALDLPPGKRLISISADADAALQGKFDAPWFVFADDRRLDPDASAVRGREGAEADGRAHGHLRRLRLPRRFLNLASRQAAATPEPASAPGSSLILPSPTTVGPSKRAESPPAVSNATRDLLKVPLYGWLTADKLFSDVGDEIIRLGLPLAVASSAGPLWAGALGAAMQIPHIVGTLPAAYFVDHEHPARVLKFSQPPGMAALALTTGWMIAGLPDLPWELLGASIVWETSAAFYQASAARALRDLAGRNLAQPHSTITGVLTQVPRIVGWTVAPIMNHIALWAPSVMNNVSFGANYMLQPRLREFEFPRPPAAAGGGAWHRMRMGIAEGIESVRNNPVLLDELKTGSMHNFLLGTQFVEATIIANNAHFGILPGAIFWSMVPLGGVAGSLVGKRLSKFSLRTLLSVRVQTAVGAAALGAFTTDPVVTGAGLALTWFGFSGVQNQVIRYQSTEVPAEVRTRVWAVANMMKRAMFGGSMALAGAAWAQGHGRLFEMGTAIGLLGAAWIRHNSRGRSAIDAHDRIAEEPETETEHPILPEPVSDLGGEVISAPPSEEVGNVGASLRPETPPSVDVSSADRSPRGAGPMGSRASASAHDENALRREVFEAVDSVVHDSRAAEALTDEALTRVNDESRDTVLAVAQELAIRHRRFALFRQSLLGSLMGDGRIAAKDRQAQSLSQASVSEIERCIDALPLSDRLLLEARLRSCMEEGKPVARVDYQVARRLTQLLMENAPETSGESSGSPGAAPAGPSPEISGASPQVYVPLGESDEPKMPDHVAREMAEQASRNIADALSGINHKNVVQHPYIIRFPGADQDGQDQRDFIEPLILKSLTERGIHDVVQIFAVVNDVRMPDGRYIDGVQVVGFVSEATQLALLPEVPFDSIKEVLGKLHDLTRMPTRIARAEFLQRKVEHEMRNYLLTLPEHPETFSALRVPGSPFHPVMVKASKLGWVQYSAIHGDATLNNMVMDSRGRIFLVDLEMATVGDPDWDPIWMSFISGDPDVERGLYERFLWDSEVFDAYRLFMDIQRVIHDTNRLRRAADYGLLSPEQIEFARTKFVLSLRRARQAWGVQDEFSEADVLRSLGVFGGLSTSNKAAVTAPAGPIDDAETYLSPANRANRIDRAEATRGGSSAGNASVDWVSVLSMDDATLVMEHLSKQLLNILGSIFLGDTPGIDAIIRPAKSLGSVLADLDRRVAQDVLVLLHPDFYDLMARSTAVQSARSIARWAPIVRMIESSLKTLVDAVGFIDEAGTFATSHPPISILARQDRLVQAFELALEKLQELEGRQLDIDGSPSTHSGTEMWSTISGTLRREFEGVDSRSWLDAADSFMSLRSEQRSGPALAAAFRRVNMRRTELHSQRVTNTREYVRESLQQASDLLFVGTRLLISTTWHTAGWGAVTEALYELEKIAYRSEAPSSLRHASKMIRPVLSKLNRVVRNDVGLRQADRWTAAFHIAHSDLLDIYQKVQEIVDNAVAILWADELADMSDSPNPAHSNPRASIASDAATGLEALRAEVFRVVGNKNVADRIVTTTLDEVGGDSALLPAAVRERALENLRFARHRQLVLRAVLFDDASGNPSHVLVRAVETAGPDEWEQCLQQLQPDEREHFQKAYWYASTDADPGITRRARAKLARGLALLHTGPNPDPMQHETKSVQSPNFISGLRPPSEYRPLGGASGVSMPDGIARRIVEIASREISHATMIGNYHVNLPVEFNASLNGPGEDFGTVRYLVRFPWSDGDGLDVRTELEWKTYEVLTKYRVNHVPPVFKVLDDVEMLDGSHVDGVMVMGYVENSAPIADLDSPPWQLVLERIRQLHREAGRIPAGDMDAAEFIRLKVDELAAVVGAHRADFGDVFEKMGISEDMAEPLIAQGLMTYGTRCQIIHNDLHPGNILLVADENQVFFIDWELARVGPLAFERARFDILTGRPSETLSVYHLLLLKERTVNDAIRLSRASSYGLLSAEQMLFIANEYQAAWESSHPVPPDGVSAPDFYKVFGVFDPPPATTTIASVRPVPHSAQSTAPISATAASDATLSDGVSVAELDALTGMEFNQMMDCLSEMETGDVHDLLLTLRSMVDDHLVTIRRGGVSGFERLTNIIPVLKAVIIEMRYRLGEETPYGRVNDNAMLISTVDFLKTWAPVARDMAAAADVLFDATSAMSIGFDDEQFRNHAEFTEHIHRLADQIARNASILPWRYRLEASPQGTPAARYKDPVETLCGYIYATVDIVELWVQSPKFVTPCLGRTVDPAISAMFEALPVHAANFDRVAADAAQTSSKNYAAAAGGYLASALDVAVFYLTRSHDTAAGLRLLERSRQVLLNASIRLPDLDALREALSDVERLYTELLDLSDDLPKQQRTWRIAQVVMDLVSRDSSFVVASGKALTALRHTAAPPRNPVPSADWRISIPPGWTALRDANASGTS